MKLFRSVSFLLLALAASGCAYQIGTERPIKVGAGGYDGKFEVEGLELRYHIPRRLIGPSYFTFASDQFHDASDLRIFVTSFGAGNGGISLGLSPYPGRLATTRDLPGYREYYEHHAGERGLRVRVTAEEISGLTWMRIEESYKNGAVARVIFARPILSDYQLVCRFGLSDDMDQEARSARWDEWAPAMAEVMSTFQITRKSKGPTSPPQDNRFDRLTAGALDHT